MERNARGVAVVATHLSRDYKRLDAGCSVSTAVEDGEIAGVRFVLRDEQSVHMVTRGDELGWLKVRVLSSQ